MPPTDEGPGVNRLNQLTQGPRKWVLLAITVVLVLGVALTYHAVNLHRGRQPQPGPAAPHQTQDLQPSNLEQVRSWFGPWETAEVTGTEPNQLVMLFPDGHLDASSWMTASGSDWSRASLFDTTVSMGYDKANLKIGASRYHAVFVGQPFVLQEDPSLVYAVLRAYNAQGYIIVSQPAAWVYAHGHNR